MVTGFKHECTIAAASKASAASWQRPVACSLQPACRGEGWWLKGFSASGITCISEASSVPDDPANQVMGELIAYPANMPGVL